MGQLGAFPGALRPPGQLLGDLRANPGLVGFLYSILLYYYYYFFLPKRLIFETGMIPDLCPRAEWPSRTL